VKASLKGKSPFNADLVLISNAIGTTIKMEKLKSVVHQAMNNCKSIAYSMVVITDKDTPTMIP
jgi:hypothetical protein